MRTGLRILVGALLLLGLALSAHFLTASVNAPHEGNRRGNTPVTDAQVAFADQSGTDMPMPLPSDTTRPSVTPTPSRTPTLTATPMPTATPTPEVRPLRRRFEAEEDDIVTRVRPGVYHISRVTNDPLRINVLLFDITAPEFDIRTALGEGWLSGRARTSYMAWQNDALAGVNGDLFSAAGVPEGFTMIDSRVAVAPKYRATFAWSKDRQPFIGYFTENWTWDAAVVAPDGSRAPLTQVNWWCQEELICLYNDFARIAPARWGDVKVLLTPAGRVAQIVEGEQLFIDAGMQVLQGTGVGAEWLLENLEIDDRVTLDITTDPPLSDYEQGISGGPIILEKGRFVQDCFCTLRDCTLAEEEDLLCEDFTYDWKFRHYQWVQMPRTGIGYDKNKQTLIVAVVDGYQLGFSRGATQREFADLLREFGAYTAMELDGGGSTTMVLEDEIVNYPSDDTGERHVANALLFFWNDEPPPAPEFVPSDPLPRPALKPR